MSYPAITTDTVSRISSNPAQPDLSLSYFRKTGYLKFLEEEKKKFTNGLDNIKLLNLRANKRQKSFITGLTS